MKYRPDIDGLRAVAVVAVVAFHSGVPGVHGGFVGVDVFFAISGFLITGILLEELDTGGRIDFVHFYSRRMRRILPNLLLVITVTSVAGLFILTPAFGETQDLAKAAAAAVLMIANFYYLATTFGYFAAPIALPLLHTWSLSVEEQFYLLWPVLMLGAWVLGRRFGRPRLALGITFICSIVASFALAWLWSRREDGSAFYLAPSRAWELAFGGLIAIGLSNPVPRYPRLGNLAALVGLATILGSTLFIRAGNLLQVPLAAIPVLGTGLVILGNALAPNGPAARLLSLEAAVTVGLASYGWYLWHWPMLALARIRTGEPNRPRDVAISLLALAISLLLLKWFEQPMRFAGRQWLSDKRVVVVGGTAMMIALALAEAIGLAATNPHLTPREAMLLTAKYDTDPRQFRCALELGNVPAQQALGPCLATGLGPRVLLWGDSFARHWSPALDAWANRQTPRVEIEFLTKASCPPLLGVVTKLPFASTAKYGACRVFNDLVAERIRLAGNHRPAGVFISAYWPTDQTLLAALHDSLRLVQSSGLRAVVVLWSPRPAFPSGFPMQAPECILRRGADNCFMPLQQHRQATKNVNQTIERIASDFNKVRIFDPADVLCPDGKCRTMIDGVVVYKDGGHITPAMARKLSGKLEPDLDWLVGDDKTTAAP